MRNGPKYGVRTRLAINTFSNPSPQGYYIMNAPLDSAPAYRVSHHRSPQNVVIAQLSHPKLYLRLEMEVMRVGLSQHLAPTLYSTPSSLSALLLCNACCDHHG